MISFFPLHFGGTFWHKYILNKKKGIEYFSEEKKNIL